MDILDKTYFLLENTSIPVTQIASDCEISKEWIYKFKRREYIDPGVRRIHKLHDYLSQESESA